MACVLNVERGDIPVWNADQGYVSDVGAMGILEVTVLQEKTCWISIWLQKNFFVNMEYISPSDKMVHISVKVL